MSTKVIPNSLLPLPGFAAINLFGVLFTRKGVAVDDTLLRHEEIHTRQMREMGYLPFYLWYVAEWALRFLAALLMLPLTPRKRRRHRLYDAYARIWFEREAYRHAPDADYLSRRRPYAWLRETRR
ncbi:MAG: hypothetical protein IJ762_09910 [Bacteroidaceae bacterium]|nr:hypothetical protein [Bacteroidaceae bacterium]MBR1789483.1 hypothetical protein [Bacteroidaceae bacterium]